MNLAPLYEQAKKHFVDSVAVSTAVNPIYAALETQAAGMNNEIAMNSRIFGTTLTFLGFGRLYSKGREISQRIFKITKESSERAKEIHDTAYCVAFNLLISPPFYLAAGGRDFKEIAKGTLASCLVGLLSGAPLGYSIDTFRDLARIKKSERVPKWLSDKDEYTKYAYAILAATASVGALSAIFHFNR